MRVGPLITGAGFEISAIRDLTGLVDFDRVDIRPAPDWMLRVWRGPVAAMTVMNRIFVHPRWLSGDEPNFGPLLVHELVHVRQWTEAGPVRFIVRYVNDYLRARLSGCDHDTSYRRIRYEVEAGRIAGI
ncbi:MAG: DUF4157 domain-containing protein [Acidimicrobiia bacterium]